MNRTTLKHIEQELYDYKENKKYLEELKLNEIEASPDPDEPHGSGTSNPTERIGLRLLSSKEILWLEHRLQAIDRVIELFKQDQVMNLLIEYKYFNRDLTDLGVANKLNIGTTTYYRKKKLLLNELKKSLGW